MTYNIGKLLKKRGWAIVSQKELDRVLKLYNVVYRKIDGFNSYLVEVINEKQRSV